MRNGSGVYSRTDGVRNGSSIFVQQLAAGLNVTASLLDAEANDMATAISESIARDGQTTITADIPFSGFKPTDIAAATARTDAARASQVQDNSLCYAGDSTGAGNLYTLTLSPAITAYANGCLILFRADKTNTGNATVNINGVGVGEIRLDATTQLEAGDIQSGQFCLITRHSDTYFRLLNPFNPGRYSGTAIVSNTTSDGADTGAYAIFAGGGFTSGRGAQLALYGADHPVAAGQASLRSDGGALTLGSLGSHDVTFQTNTTTRWTLEADGDLSSEATNGGNLIFSGSSKGVILTPVTGLALAGTNQGTATAITARFSEFTTASGTFGAILPSTAPIGSAWTVVNQSASSPMRVYPPVGDSINNSATNVEYSSMTGRGAITFVRASANKWYTVSVQAW